MPDSNLAPTSTITAPIYRYFVVDISTNKVLNELPFQDVSYSQSLKEPGEFSGTIYITPETENLDLYTATLPGKTALYIMRGDECVWGGLIWNRTYALVDRSIEVSGQEFTSYLSRRIIWKTYSYNYEATATKKTSSGYVLLTLENRVLPKPIASRDSDGKAVKVYVGFVQESVKKYSGFYEVVDEASTPPALSDPTKTFLYVNMPTLPVPKTSSYYSNVTVTTQIDTYSYIRELIQEAFQDFSGISFANEVLAPGIKTGINIQSKQLEVTGARSGLATITTDTPHNLVQGQKFTIANVDELLDGSHVVSEVPNDTTIKFELINPINQSDKVTALVVEEIPLTYLYNKNTLINYREIVQYIVKNVQKIKRTLGTVTLTLTTPHTFEVGDKVKLTIQNQPPARKSGKNTFDYSKSGIDAIVLTSVDQKNKTITFVDPITDHAQKKYNVKESKVKDSKKNTVKLSYPITQFMLTPQSDGHGFYAGETIKVSGVDSVNWQYPLYNGYHVVDQVSMGSPKTIVKYKVLDEICYLYFNDNPKFNDGDYISISGISLLNGEYPILAEPEVSGSYWYVSFSKQLDDVAIQNAPSGSTASRDGMGWFTYLPENMQLSSKAVEPDAVSNISKLSMKVKNKKKTITLETGARHNMSVGDIVKVTVGAADKSDNKTYGGSKTITSISDYDEISYNISSSKGPSKSFKAKAKTGTIVRTKSRIGYTDIVEVPFSGIRTVGSLTKVSAIDHDFNIGDYVALSFDGTNFDSYATEQAPVKIVEATSNTFSYPLQAGASPAGTQMRIKAVDFYKTTKGKFIKFTAVGDYTYGSSVNYDVNSITGTLEATLGDGKKYQRVLGITTASTNNATVGSVVSVNGLPAATSTSTVLPARTSKITNMTYASGFLVVTVEDWHRLDTSDIGTSAAKIKLSGLETVSGTYNGSPKNIDLSVVNGNWNIYYDADDAYAAPLSTYSFSIKTDLWSKPWSWTPATPAAEVYFPTKTQVETSQNLSMYNGTASVVYVESSTKFYIKNDLISYDFSSIDVSAETVTVDITPRQTTTARPSISKNDLIDISGFKNISRKYYSKLNKTWTVVSSSTGTYGSAQATFFVVKNNIGAVYPDRTSITSTEVVSGYKYQKAPGTAYLDYLSSSQTVKDIANVYRANDRPNLVKLTSPAHGVEANDYINVWVYTRGGIFYGHNNSPRRVVKTTEDTITYAVAKGATITSAVGDGSSVTYYAYNDFAVGDKVAIYDIEPSGYNSASATITAADTSSFTVASSETSVFVSGGIASINNVNLDIEYVQIDNGIAQLWIKENRLHNYCVGDQITLSGFTSTYSSLNGVKTITLIGARTIKVATGIADTARARLTGSEKAAPYSYNAIDEDYNGVIIPSPMVSVEPTLFVASYGEFTQSAGIGGMDFSTTDYSSDVAKNEIIRGSELTTISDVVEKYSNSLNGFDYRIECNRVVDGAGDSYFTRTFVLSPTKPKSLTEYLDSLPERLDYTTGVTYRGLATGQVVDPSILGADKIVFEYPGNIIDLSLAESSENAATRMFISGTSNESGGGDATYSAASATDLLRDGWPILDRAENVEWSVTNSQEAIVDRWGNYDSELDFHNTARRYLYESRPPISDISITVNGSISPLIGTYKPGNWCSIVVNDEFIKQRLNTVLEPRKDIFVRKIDSVSVTVPNNPAFPEEVSLTLIVDWQVDRVGE